MKKRWVACFVIVLLQWCAGCSLTEVRGKSKFGVENRYEGSSRSHEQRWLAQQGFDFTWRDKDDRKFTTGVTYRRRDVDEGGGDHDDGVWIDFSFPIWKAPRDPVARKIDLLERRLARLEAERHRLLTQDSMVASAPVEKPNEQANP